MLLTFVEEKMCWKTLLLLLLCYDAQATVSHRWSRGELLFLYLFDAHHSSLSTIRNFGVGECRREKEMRSPISSSYLVSANCFMPLDTLEGVRRWWGK